MHLGSWGTPDLGITEAIARLLGQNVNQQGGSNLSGRSIVSPVPAVNTSSQVHGAGGVTTVPTSQPYRSNQQVLGTNTNSFGGGSTSAPVNTGGGDSSLSLADSAYRAALSQADAVRSSGQQTFNDILKSISAFRDRSQTLKDNSGQEIVNTAAETLGSNARTGQELQGQARARGRAAGLGDSSKFLNQNKIDANLAATQGATLAKKGENIRANDALFQDRQAQADQQTNEANSYLRQINDSANAVRDAGANNFGGALNNIVNYQRQLSAINPLQAGSLTGLKPDFSGINDVLSGVLASIGNGNNASDPNAGANPVDFTTITDLLKKRGIVN